MLVTYWRGHVFVWSTKGTVCHRGTIIVHGSIKLSLQKVSYFRKIYSPSQAHFLPHYAKSRAIIYSVGLLAKGKCRFSSFPIVFPDARKWSERFGDNSSCDVRLGIGSGVYIISRRYKNVWLILKYFRLLNKTCMYLSVYIQSLKSKNLCQRCS